MFDKRDTQERLQEAFGPKKGQMLFQHARGINDNVVDGEQIRKSLAVEINWGLRFLDTDPVRFRSLRTMWFVVVTVVVQVDPFLDEVCREVAARLQDVGMRGRAVSVKVNQISVLVGSAAYRRPGR
jgi:DNA repair protein REV1